MPDLLQSVLSTTISVSSFLLCTAASLVLGAGIALCHMFKNHCSKSFVITLAMLPAIVQVVIMMVNGNIGTGVAVMGAFSLVRFRSAPGSAKEIGGIFLAMAVGLATGMGYIGIAVLVTILLCAVNMLYTATPFGEGKKGIKELRITIPENLDYTGIFDDLFSQYTNQAELMRVKTSHMGSLFQLSYHILLKDDQKEKEFIDAIRCRNGNLDIICSREMTEKDEL